MYTLFAWYLAGVIQTPNGTQPVYQWTSMGQYSTLIICHRVANTELHLPKHKCVKEQ